MARYRSKDEGDLRWNQIRRIVTRELDTKILAWREAALNSLLTNCWSKYTASLESGEKLTLETEYEDFASRALTEKTGIDLTAI